MKYILATPTGIRVSGNSGDNEWEQETMNGSPAPVIIQYKLLGPFVTTALWNGSTLSYYILFYYRIFFEYHETDCVVSFSKFLFVGAEKDTTTFLRSLRKTDVDIVSPVLFYLI